MLNPLYWLALPFVGKALGQSDRAFWVKVWLTSILAVGLPLGQQPVNAQDVDAQDAGASALSFESFTIEPSSSLGDLTFDHPLLQPFQVDFPSPFDGYSRHGDPLDGSVGRVGHQPAIAQQPDLDLDPAIIEGSPVLQRWLQGPPDITHDIQHQPSFRPRLRVGYAHFPSTDSIGGIALGVEDLFVLPSTGLTISGDYSRGRRGLRQDYGAEARYYLLPLGGYVNLAPTVGYRALTTPTYSTDGLSLGLRLMVVPSRGGAADLAISHQWVAVGGDREVGLTRFSLGYAVTGQLRLGTDLQFQNSQFGQDSRLGLSLEWLL